MNINNKECVTPNSKVILNIIFRVALQVEEFVL